MKAKRYDEAIAKLTAALAMKPDPKNAAMLHAVRAGAFLYKDDVTHAEPDAMAAVRLDPSSAVRASKTRPRLSTEGAECGGDR